jgi:hypothetical protein
MRWRLVAKIEPLQVSQEGRRLVNQLKADIERHAASFRQIVSLYDAGSLPEATASYKEHGALAGAAMEQTAFGADGPGNRNHAGQRGSRPGAGSFCGNQYDGN